MKRILIGIFFLIIAASFTPAANQSDDQIVLWNRCMETLREEWDTDGGIWFRLRDSLNQDPPHYTRSMDRANDYKRLIELTEERLGYLRQMHRLEAK